MLMPVYIKTVTFDCADATVVARFWAAALGTDMDGIGPGAIFTSYARWPSLAAALLDRGYRPEEVGKILGGNAQRVFRRVGDAARKS